MGFVKVDGTWWTEDFRYYIMKYPVDDERIYWGVIRMKDGKAEYRGCAKTLKTAKKICVREYL